MNERHCQQCGAPFSPRRETARFCSRSCWGLSKRNSPAEVLAAKTVRDDTTGCLVWTGYTAKGYGRFTIGHRPALAHRYAFQLRYGAIPDGLLVCHHCDNPLCCEPEHLFLGTEAENSADMVSKNRQRRGEGHSKAKLTRSEVQAIRTSGSSSRAAAEHFGVSPTQIKRIRRMESWRHVA